MDTACFDSIRSVLQTLCGPVGEGRRVIRVRVGFGIQEKKKENAVTCIFVCIYYSV